MAAENNRPIIAFLTCENEVCSAPNWMAAATFDGTTGGVPRLMDPHDYVCPTCHTYGGILMEWGPQSSKSLKKDKIIPGTPWVCTEEGYKPIYE